MRNQLAPSRIVLCFSALAVAIGICHEAQSEEEHGHYENGHDEHSADAHGHAGHGSHDRYGPEGMIRISPEVQRSAKIEIAQAEPATLNMLLKVNGRISPVSSKVAHITSRFSGIVKEVRKDIGDEAKAGEVLAIVESNQNLQAFEVRTLKSGLITERHATLGEFAAEGTPLFVVADLSELWADFTVFQRDVAKIRVGQVITVNADGGNPSISTTLHFLSPIVDETTQSRQVRAVLSHPAQYFAPGAFVTGEIAVGEIRVPLAVSYDAVQTVAGKSVVFVNAGDRFQKREIATGRSDGKQVEVLSGLAPGERYAATNTFLLKAELGKSEAEHEH